MEIFVTIIHVLVGIFLILVVLLQSGKGGGIGAGLGGGSSTGVFGARGANTFLSRVTAGCAIVFFLTSMTLAVLSSKTGSVMKDYGKPAPGVPAPQDAALNPAGTATDMPPPAPDAGGQTPLEVPPPPANPNK